MEDKKRAKLLIPDVLFQTGALGTYSPQWEAAVNIQIRSKRIKAALVVSN